LTGRAGGWVGRILAVGSLAAAVLLAVFAISRLDRRPRSQDAFVYAYSTGLVPEVSGRITAVHVRENQRVTKDDILVEIEREPYELHLAQAQAELAALRAQIDLSSRQVASQSTAARAAATEIQGAVSQLDLAKTTAEDRPRSDALVADRHLAFVEPRDPGAGADFHAQRPELLFGRCRELGRIGR
jgi:multidrug efflux system membrane fusion protein